MKTLSIHSKILYLLTFISLLSISSASPQFKENDLRQTGSIVFGVIGDYGRAGQPAADVANLVKRWNPNFIVTVGDNNYPDGAAYSMDQNIGQYYHDYIFKYNGKYGGGSATQRFFPALATMTGTTTVLMPTLIILRSLVTKDIMILRKDLFTFLFWTASPMNRMATLSIQPRRDGSRMP